MGKIPSSSWDSNFNPRDERHWSFARDSRGYGLNYRWTDVDDFEIYHPIKTNNKSIAIAIFTVIVTALLFVVVDLIV